MKHLPPFEVMSELLDYSESDGKLFWKYRAESHFSRNRISVAGQCSSFNARRAGKEAFTFVDGKGYRSGRLLGVAYKAHRIAFKLATKLEPQFIDHIDGDRQNNRISNLRSVDVAQNSKNVALRNDNKSGCHGVHFCNTSNKWVSRIVVSGTHIFVGAFNSKDDAASARKAAEILHGFHKNHGRKAKIEAAKAAEKGGA